MTTCLLTYSSFVCCSLFLPTQTAQPEQLTLALPPILQNDLPNLHGFVDADMTLGLWTKVALTTLAPCKQLDADQFSLCLWQQFNFLYREEDWFVFPLTIHLDVSGQLHMLLLLRGLIVYHKGFEAVEFVIIKVSAVSQDRLSSCVAGWLTLSSRFKISGLVHNRPFFYLAIPVWTHLLLAGFFLSDMAGCVVCVYWPIGWGL